MDKEQIKELALANGFKLKRQQDGSMGLNPYVYEFAQAVVKSLLPDASLGCYDPPSMHEIFHLPVGGEHFSINGNCKKSIFDDGVRPGDAVAYAVNHHDNMRAANITLAQQRNEQAAEIERLRGELHSNRVDYTESYQALKQERDQLKEHCRGQEKLLSSGIVYTYAELAAHDAALIERARQYATSRVEEHETADQYDWALVEFTEQLLGSAEEVKPSRFPDCEIECGAYGTYCKCADDAAAEEVKS
ncbi:hypothetical protein [Marinobacterium litorale]|uniref:hypothetical protein n=1 Tax=Marinobacterium litorale TaxID=404770 RepID=UPI0004004D2A|nr:hypothetical protein [Marinobacterium litorale]